MDDPVREMMREPKELRDRFAAHFAALAARFGGGHDPVMEDAMWRAANMLRHGAPWPVGASVSETEVRILK